MKVFIGVPSYAGIFDEKTKVPRCPGFAKSLANTLELLEQCGIQVAFKEIIGNCYVQMARNELAQNAWDEKADVFVQVDDDMEWEAEDFLRLCEMTDEVACGVYRKKQEAEDYPVAVPTYKDFRFIVRNDGCIRADFVPTGFLFIKRSALSLLRDQERIYEVWDGAKKTGEFHDIFPQGLADGRMWGEDFGFCRLWRSAGGQIWIVPNITLIHHGRNGSYRGNYHEFLLRLGKSNDSRANQENRAGSADPRGVDEGNRASVGAA